MSTENVPITLDDSQRAACELVLSASVGVVTGGPGTGKSTSLRTALDRIDQDTAAGYVGCPACRPNGAEIVTPIGTPPCARCGGEGVVWRHDYLLAAPTGKAARRISEVTGREATTVHRLLDYGPVPGSPNGMGFRRNALRPIEADLVVIDEASMLDIDLALALTSAIEQSRTRLVLVGDVAQLPPVGPGRVFADVIESGVVPVARLTTLHRAAQESWVCTQAREVLEGRLPDLEPRADFRFVPIEDARTIVQAAVSVAEWLRGEGADYQVLIPQNPGAAGTQAANQALAQALCPFDGGRMWTVVADVKLWRGLRVIQTVNDYTLDVMNGEQGVVASLGDTELIVELEGGREVRYSRGQAERLRLAYALTVHKSQGSEWPWVVVVCHSTHTFSLSRALLYTAITRAKKGVVLVGDVAGIKRAVGNGRDAVRNSGLAERLRRVA